MTLDEIAIRYFGVPYEKVKKCDQKYVVEIYKYKIEQEKQDAS